jgi:WD40 repeat protein
MTARSGFQVGGAVQQGALYVARRADRELLEALRHGEFCYILAPRQIGKSSLRIRVGQALAREGVRCVSIDFSGIGATSVTIDEWYYSIADDIAQSLGLPNLDLFWTTHQHLTPVHRWYRFIRNELLDRVAGPVVVFIDEVDSVLALSFATDDFFASIRSAYNLRADDPEYCRLTFCLLGVAAPADLIQNSVRTPFNIGKEIRLDDFSRAELATFRPGLEGLGCDPDALLDAVYAWTAGHPYMTQRLCDELERHGPVEGGNEVARVDDAAFNLFVRSGRGGDANLAYAEKRLDMNASRIRVRQMLYLYRKLLDGEKVPAEPNSQVQTELRLTGLAAEFLADGEIYLRTRNLIFAEVYDHKWLKTKEKEQRLAELVERWASSGKLDDYLLRGAALEDALVWSQGRGDLTVSDHEFLLAGVNYARREAEGRHRIEETARKEEAAGRKAIEEQRKADRERYRADIERERRERAEEGALSQRRTISILTGTVALLGLLLALAAWQYIVAERSKSLLAEIYERNNEIADLEHDGAEALLLAQQPGKEREALRRAIQAASRSMQKGRQVPPRVLQGLAAAVATPVQRPNVLRHAEAIVDAVFSHDGTRVLTASRDASAHLWDSVSGRSIRTFDEHGGPVLKARFSDDDARIFTISADRNLRLWNVSSGDIIEPTYKFAAGGRFVAEVAPGMQRAVLSQTDRNLRLLELDGSKRSELLRGHTAAISAAAFSPDGLRLVTACADGSARLWNATTGRMITSMRRHAGPILGVVFASDGKRIVTIGEDRTARLWSEQGVHIAGLTAHTGPILGAVFSGDNATVATHSEDRSAILWGAQSGKEIAVLGGHTDAVLDLSFSGDSRRIVTASADTTARVWTSDGVLVVELIGHTDHVRMARISPDSARVLTASDDNTARLWNSSSGNVVATLEGHTAKVRIGRFSPDGTRVLTVGDDNTARIWDASLSNAIPTLKGHSAPIRMARFSPEGSRIVTVSDDKTARLWDATTPEYNQVSTLHGHTGPVSSVVFSSEGAGHMITLAEDDPTLRLWNSQTGALLHAPKHAGPVLAATFSRDGARMISAGADDTLRVWEVDTGVELTDKACQGMHGRVDFAALAPGGTFALIANRSNNRAVLVPAGCGEDIDLVGHSGPVTGAAFSPDGDLVATISTDNTTKLWSTRYGNDIDTLDTGSGSVHSVNFSRDGTRLVIATARDAWVYSLNIDDGHQPVVFATLQGHSGAVLHASFSSNGARIVTASSDNTAKLWALANPGYELIATLHGHSAAVSFADFSPDGSLVVTAGRDSRAKVYPTTLEAFFKKACEALRSHDDPDFNAVASTCGGPSTTPPGATPGT